MTKKNNELLDGNQKGQNYYLVQAPFFWFLVYMYLVFLVSLMNFWRERNDYLVQAGTTTQGISPAGIATPNSVARGELLTPLSKRQSVGNGFGVDTHLPPEVITDH